MSKWIRNPLATNNVSRPITCEKEQLIHTSCDGSLKDMFAVDQLHQFQLLVENNYKSSSDRAINVAVMKEDINQVS
jgi:hypothetical protein